MTTEFRDALIQRFRDNHATSPEEFAEIAVAHTADELRRLVAEARRQVHEDPPPHDPHDYLDQIEARADYLAEREGDDG